MPLKRTMRLRTETGKVLADIKGEYGISNQDIYEYQDPEGRRGPDPVRLSRISRGRDSIPIGDQTRHNLAARIAKAIVGAIVGAYGALPTADPDGLSQEIYQRIKVAMDADVLSLLPTREGTGVDARSGNAGVAHSARTTAAGEEKS